MAQGSLNQSMEYSVAELLSKIKENREIHEKNFNEAIKEYNIELEAEFTKKLALLKSGSVINPNTQLIIPRKYTDSYDKYIDMLGFTTQTTVSLSADEFDNLIRDNWHWKESFNNSTMLYSKQM